MTRKKRKNFFALAAASDFINFTKKIEDCQFYIIESSFYRKFLTSLKESFEAVNIDNVSHCICYGLGNFSSSVASRYQLAFLLLLKDQFKVDVDIYDPVFLQTELELLRKLNLNVVEKNEEGLRKLESATFMYMPHCPTALVNNLLWSNWQSSLSHCIIFGNSFTLLSETLTERNLKTKYRCIHSIFPVTSEFRIENDFKYSDIFNDLSLHVFTPTALKELPSSFWKNMTKPIYDDSDVECISKKVSEIEIDQVNDKNSVM